MKILKNSLGTIAGLLALSLSGVAFADTTLDLTAAPPNQNSPIGGSIGNGTFTQNFIQPTGSGVIQSFVRISTNQTLVQGYNTTANNVYNNDSSDTFNHAITVGQVGFTNIGGVDKMRFLLDINQTKNEPFHSLDEVQIFLSTTPNIDNGSTAVSQGVMISGLGNYLVYQMDSGGQNNTVLLNYSLNSGSGTGDMTLDIPATAFDPIFDAMGLKTDAAKNGAYIYLYSRLGTSANLDPNQNPNNDGYEEWTYIKGNPIGGECVPTEQNPCGGPPQTIPEPGTLALMATGLFGLAYKRRKFSK
jgi:hypothetical protein